MLKLHENISDIYFIKDFSSPEDSFASDATEATEGEKSSMRFGDITYRFLPEISETSDISIIKKDFVQIGGTSYKFWKSITINSIGDYQSGDWICWSSDLDASVIGKGDSALAAQEDFETELHTAFQRLYRKRPFEMNEQEQKLWQRLVNVIDVHLYKTTTPLLVREIGQISYGMISRPYRIKWLTGYNYIIDPHNVPNELMSMRPGQYIEAVVERDPLTHKERKIVSVKSISFHLPNEQEAKRIWEEMPAADLPEGGWD